MATQEKTAHTAQDKSATLQLFNAWQTERKIVEAIVFLSQLGNLHSRAASLHNNVKDSLNKALADSRELLEEL